MNFFSGRSWLPLVRVFYPPCPTKAASAPFCLQVAISLKSKPQCMNSSSSKPSCPSRDLQVTRIPKAATRPHLQKVLVADDDEDILCLEAGSLREAGYDVDAVANGLEAWEAILRSDYDLVITDNDMPHLTGLELLGRIRESGMQVPVVIASGSLFGKPLRNIWESVIVILPKPFCMFQLLEAALYALNASKVSFTGLPMQAANNPIKTDHDVAKLSKERLL
jgi:CheY-like chemotaxis protein